MVFWLNGEKLAEYDEDDLKSSARQVGAENGAPIPFFTRGLGGDVVKVEIYKKPKRGK